jgi:hypothetical protein
MGHITEVQIREEKFTYTDKAKRLAFILMGAGLLLALIGYFTYHPHIEGFTDEQNHHLPIKRLLGSILFNGYFFFVIAATATAFLAINALANTGWHIAVKRVIEAVTAFMPVGAIAVFVVVALSLLVFHGGIYHWAHDGVMAQDALLAKKNMVPEQTVFPYSTCCVYRILDCMCRFIP